MQSSYFSRLGLLIKLTLVCIFASSWLLANAPQPVKAASGSITYDPSANVAGASCEASAIGLHYSITGTNTDGTWLGQNDDAIGYAVIDGTGHVLSGQMRAIPVGTTVNSDAGTLLPLTQITMREVIVVLFDTTSISSIPGSLIGSRIIDFFRIDTATIAASCSGLLAVTAPNVARDQIVPAETYMRLLGVAATSCTPGDSPQFYTRISVSINIATDHIYTLTNMRTGTVAPTTYAPVVDPGPLGPSDETVTLLNSTVPSDTLPGDVLTERIETRSLDNTIIDTSSYTFDCSTGRPPGDYGTVPRIAIYKMYFPGGCFMPATVYIPKSANGPAYYMTRQTFEDCRVNQDPAANVALYCQDGNLSVYILDKAIGYYAFGLSKDDLNSVQPDPKANILIARELGARLYRLPDGSLQVNKETIDPNKEYMYRWGGC